MKKLFLLLVSLTIGGTSVLAKDCKQDLVTFIKYFEGKVGPAYKDANEAAFNARISGEESDYKKSSDLQIKLSDVYSNKDDYKKLKDLRTCNDVKKDKDLYRQSELMLNQYTSKQIDPKKLEALITLQTEMENKFSTFRSEVDGKKLTDNEVEKILKTSTDSKELEATWKASKAIGPVVAEDVKKLVLMRNAAAKELGYKNYHQMMLKLDEQDPNEVEKLFNELDTLTRPAYAKLKKEIDSALAKKLGIATSKLQPWHYQNRYFQEAPQIYTVDLDTYYKNADVAGLTKTYYDGLGMNSVEDAMKSSDLYEKKGKYQHACCDNIDRRKDVRVTCNITPSEHWMDTSLHEFGHAVYEEYMNQDMPWIYREPAHTFTTEAIAMMFGRMASNPQWMHDMLNISKEEQEKIADISFKTLRMEQLVFSRWSQVMYRFEKSMYENPNQDLNALWWKLVEKYQLVKKPAGWNNPDWATKIHVALYPAYYHNYLMGALVASQLSNYVATNIIKSKDIKNQSYVGRIDVGQYFKDKVFYPGRKEQWNTMIKNATGEKLTAKYYAKQFVNE